MLMIYKNSKKSIDKLYGNIYNIDIATNHIRQKPTLKEKERDNMKFEEYMNKANTIIKLVSEMRSQCVTDIATTEQEYMVDAVELLLESIQKPDIDFALKTLNYLKNKKVITGLIQKKDDKYFIKDIELKEGDRIEYLEGDEWFFTFWENNKIFDSEKIEPIGTLAKVRR